MLSIDVRSSAGSIVVLFIARAHEVIRLIEANRSPILDIHMQPDSRSARRQRRSLHMLQQLKADALSAHLWKNFDGLDVCADFMDRLRPFDDREARQGSIVFGTPGGRILALHQPPHVASAECHWRLKANLLDAVNGLKVFRLINAVIHSVVFRMVSVRKMSKKKSHPPREDGSDCKQRA